MLVEETTFSFVAEVPEPNWQPVAFDRSRFDSGVAIRGTARSVCFLRRLTSAGAIIHADFDAVIGERLSLELGGGQRLDGIVVWQSGFEAGLKFERPVDVFAVIARNLVSMPGERRRMPRIELNCAAYIEAASGTEMATTRDVSHGGVKIESGLRLEAGDSVQVTLDGLFPLAGVVRWVGDGLAGIGFMPEPSWHELMPWLKEMRALAARRPEPARAPAPAAQRHPALARLDDRDEGSVHLNLPARVREGTRRWNIQVKSLTAEAVEFESFSPINLGALLWVVLPGLEGWSARVTRVEGHRFTCGFTHPLHPLVLERILAARGEG